MLACRWQEAALCGKQLTPNQIVQKGAHVGRGHAVAFPLDLTEHISSPFCPCCAYQRGADWPRGHASGGGAALFHWLTPVHLYRSALCSGLERSVDCAVGTLIFCRLSADVRYGKKGNAVRGDVALLGVAVPSQGERGTEAAGQAFPQC